ATLGVFPLLVLLTRWFQRNSAAAYRRTRETVALVIVHFVESLGGIRAVQAFRREPRNQEIFEQLNDDYRRATERSFQLVAIYGPGIKLLGNITIGVILFYGGTRVLGGDMTLGVLAAFLLYLRRFFEPMQELSQFYNSFQSAAAALEKLSGVLEEPLSVAEPAAPERLREARGAVSFRDVRFGYDDRVVIPSLRLEIPAGQTVALVGATGAGKTTVARLLARFYDPNAGEVLLDGVPLRDLAGDDLRRSVVLVTQESYIFSGTVADNILFGRPGASPAPGLARQSRLAAGDDRPHLHGVAVGDRVLAGQQVAVADDEHRIGMQPYGEQHVAHPQRPVECDLAVGVAQLDDHDGAAACRGSIRRTTSDISKTPTTPASSVTRYSPAGVARSAASSSSPARSAGRTRPGSSGRESADTLSHGRRCSGTARTAAAETSPLGLP
ncbi:MAG: ABC transporter ATP-binding protein/permease, partial [Frankia sp.]|nr:ABC transporter ATP-binding protein/permease [Frankia sp.]